MKVAREWRAYEERLNYKVITGPERVSEGKKGTVVLVILRGETLEVTYIYYPPGRKFKTAESVEEARRQFRIWTLIYSTPLRQLCISAPKVNE